MILDRFFRSLPDFKGKQRIARIIYRSRIKNGSDLHITGSFGCKYLLPNLVENISFELFINGIYEKDTYDFLLKRIPLNAVLLDLGANIGSIVIPLCKKREDIRVICVEASPWVFEYLKKNVELNGIKNIELLNKAILDEDNREIAFFGPTEKFGKGSLTPNYTNISTKVETIRIDTLLRRFSLDRVDMIKIDIQGFEYYAFKGGTGLLSSSNAPDILFEFEDWAEREALGLQVGDAQNLLKEYGYDIYLLKRKTHLVHQMKSLVSGSHMLYASKRQID